MITEQMNWLGDAIKPMEAAKEAAQLTALRLRFMQSAAGKAKMMCDVRLGGQNSRLTPD